MIGGRLADNETKHIVRERFRSDGGLLGADGDMEGVKIWEGTENAHDRVALGAKDETVGAQNKVERASLTLARRRNVDVAFANKITMCGNEVRSCRRAADELGEFGQSDLGFSLCFA